MANPIVIIGAGIGGLSTAIRLAVVGHRVVIFEQSSSVGGKMGEVREAGFRWDTGPSVITMRPVKKTVNSMAQAQPNLQRISLYPLVLDDNSNLVASSRFAAN